MAEVPLLPVELTEICHCTPPFSHKWWWFFYFYYEYNSGVKTLSDIFQEWSSHTVSHRFGVLPPESNTTAVIWVNDGRSAAHYFLVWGGAKGRCNEANSRWIHLFLVPVKGSLFINLWVLHSGCRSVITAKDGTRPLWFWPRTLRVQIQSISGPTFIDPQWNLLWIGQRYCVGPNVTQ